MDRGVYLKALEKLKNGVKIQKIQNVIHDKTKQKQTLHRLTYIHKTYWGNALLITLMNK